MMLKFILGKRREPVQSVVMPQLGDSMQEGTVLCWMKLVGDFVEKDGSLVEIETDKINAEMPAPTSGVLRAIFVSPGATVPVGTVIALIGDADEPFPEAVSLLGQPVVVSQRCSDRVKRESQKSLAIVGWQGGFLAIVLFFGLLNFWPQGSWLITITIGVLLLCLGFFLGVTFQKRRSTS